MNKYLIYYQNFKKYRYLLLLLTRNQISKKYRGSILGILWSLLNPLLQMVVLTLIFSSLFKNHIENFPLYMISGRLIYEFFANGTSGTMKSIVDASALIKKVYIPKYLVTISRVLAEFVISLVALIDLVIVMLITKADFSVNILYAPIYLIFLLMFTTGISLLLSTVTIFFRDIEHIYSIFIMMLMYFSAIFYPENIIPQRFQLILQANPIYQFIDGFRNAVYYGQTLDTINLLYCILVGVFSFIIGLFIFEKYQHKFVLHI